MYGNPGKRMLSAINKGVRFCKSLFLPSMSIFPPSPSFAPILLTRPLLSHASAWGTTRVGVFFGHIYRITLCMVARSHAKYCIMTYTIVII